MAVVQASILELCVRLWFILSTGNMVRNGVSWGTALVAFPLMNILSFAPQVATKEATTCSADSGVCKDRVENQGGKASTMQESLKHDQCTLYLAQSSIPNAGLGVYTSVDFKKGDYIGEGELMIPITDLPYTEHWLVDDVQWDVDIDPRLYFESNEHNSIFYPGFGAQINCHMGLNNAEHSKPKYDSAGMHRTKDPGVGAFTNWYDMPNIALRNVKAGEGLFVNYGESWFEYRVHSMGQIPMAKDFYRADRIVRKMHTLREKHDATLQDGTGEGDGGSSSLWDKLRHIMSKGESVPAKTETPAFTDIWSMIRNVSMDNQAFHRALPERYEDLDETFKHGTARQSVGGQSSIRSQEWLEENGMCIDTMYANISTVPQAGRGAFAKRFVLKDSVVSPAPVLQINRSFLHHDPVGYQLLTNYAFGHPDSPVFLLPYSSMVNFINHDSKNPNVKLRWSTSPLHRKDFLEMSSDEVLNQGFGLLMEFVALRDIEPDEEILFDYGPEWEKAWKEHLKSWKPVKGSEDYVSAEDAKKSMGILTEEEQKLNAYPENVQTACFFYHTENTEYENITNDGDVKSVYRVEWSKPNDDCLRWCGILDRHVNETSGVVSYDALILPQTSNLHAVCVMSPDEKVYVNKIPSEAVTLVDRKLTRDQHLPNAFRHYIRLSDDVFPAAWRQDRAREVSVKAVDSEQCALYLAESSIPNAGIGIFTTVDFKAGESVGDPEIVVPVVHFSRKKWSLLQDVTWNSGHVDPYLLFESNSSTEAFIPGFGAQINCHMGLNNVRHDYLSFDSAGLSRKNDPGVGAFSSWYNLPNIATRDIVSGEELFTDYGESWFENRKQQLGIVPFEEDFEIADNLTAKMRKLLKKHGTGNMNVTCDYWNFVRESVSERVTVALPESLEDLEEAIKYGTARFSLGGAKSFRSREWLEEYGMCVDNLYADQSTTPQAGRGAFAKRFLPEGSIVAPAPMLQMHKGQLLYREGNSTQYHKQLLFNYCYGHKLSPILLVPYAPIVNFINHDSEKPNVKIRWSNSHLNSKEWLELPSHEVLQKSFGLTMEFVALHNIQKNEEIFLDYGPKWEEAWYEHTEYWSGEDFEDYVSPVELNENKASMIRTAEELESDPYPENIITACVYTPYLSLDDSYENVSTSPTGVQVVRRQWKSSETECVRPCKVIEKKFQQIAFKSKLLVTAEMLPIRGLSEECSIRMGEKHIIFSIPEEAIVFLDKAENRDPYIEGAFRQFIAIPDEEFPEAWLLTSEALESSRENGKENVWLS